ncbi:hypothetical protein HPB50_015549 [Hyalomma asiaticum]|uniref:Uncharacterized protein n=1 Tax=Hyalomma asiaticum TaxID=266040 RepID=A0ACB7SY71_HYAAI|nr:hypothetical protein HPB50_015549 [Hyalomma asiaticum]
MRHSSAAAAVAGRAKSKRAKQAAGRRKQQAGLPLRPSRIAEAPQAPSPVENGTSASSEQSPSQPWCVGVECARALRVLCEFGSAPDGVTVLLLLLWCFPCLGGALVRMTNAGPTCRRRL